MIAVRDLNIGRRVANKTSVNLNIRTWRTRVDLQLCGRGTGILIMTGGG